MATWQEIGVDNFRAAVALYDDPSPQYRSAASRLYYAVFCIVTHELIQRGATADFREQRETPGHAQMPRLVEVYFTHFTQERRDNLIGYLVGLYRSRIAADYSLQRVDKQLASKSLRAAEKVFRYLEVKHERKGSS